MVMAGCRSGHELLDGQTSVSCSQGAITVPYTFFKEQVAERNVESIYCQGESITGRFKTAVTYPPPTENSI
jgi:cell division protease FtsH